jgi:hypothetical protein
MMLARITCLAAFERRGGIIHEDRTEMLAFMYHADSLDYFITSHLVWTASPPSKFPFFLIKMPQEEVSSNPLVVSLARLTSGRQSPLHQVPFSYDKLRA